MTIDNYPSLKAALLTCIYANGGINRHRSESDALADTSKFITKLSNDQLSQMELWFTARSAAEIETVVDGEQREAEGLIKDTNGPAFLHDFLNEFFEEVV